MSDKDFDDALEALARVEGKTVDELKREMLRERVMGKRPDPEQPPARRELARVGTGDASGASLARSRREAVQQHHARDYPGSPVVRYEGDPYNETPAEAADRWYQEEAELVDGVHGLGGQTAGGIFGDGPIATPVYDPSSMGRADARQGQMASIKLLGLVEKLERRLAASEQERAQLAGQAPARRLGRGKR